MCVLNASILNYSLDHDNNNKFKIKTTTKYCIGIRMYHLVICDYLYLLLRFLKGMCVFSQVFRFRLFVYYILFFGDRKIFVGHQEEKQNLLDVRSFTIRPNNIFTARQT